MAGGTVRSAGASSALRSRPRLAHMPETTVDVKPPNILLSLTLPTASHCMHSQLKPFSSTRPCAVDVKSPNILLTANGAVRLADVGFSRVKENTFLSNGEPHCCSPCGIRAPIGQAAGI